MSETSVFIRSLKIAEEAAQKVAGKVAEGRGKPLTDQERTLVTGAAFSSIHKSALARLERSEPIVEILKRSGIPHFIGPLTQRGFYVVIREEEPGFVASIEEAAGKSLDTGTIIYPCGFGEYEERLRAVTQYREVLMISQIKSEIINIPSPGTEEDMTVLFVPLFRS